AHQYVERAGAKSTDRPISVRRLEQPRQRQYGCDDQRRRPVERAHAGELEHDAVQPAPSPQTEVEADVERGGRAAGGLGEQRGAAIVAASAPAATASSPASSSPSAIGASSGFSPNTTAPSATAPLKLGACVAAALGAPSAAPAADRAAELEGDVAASRAATAA